MTSEKLQKLKKIIKDKRKLAIAYSGGVDSTLLLSVAVEVLGVENVSAFYLSSVLQASTVTVASLQIIKNEFPPELLFQQIKASPFEWEFFENNCDNRCYFCKKQMYTTLLSYIKPLGFTVLADGTNSDDLGEVRPGLKAIREFGIFTPLQIAGFTKKEIRNEAKKRNLSNYDLASNSCLATRVDSSIKISEQNLTLIERAETFLYNLGFAGTRVRVGGQYTVIEIEEKDFNKFLEGRKKQIIEDEFHLFGLPRPCLLLKGR